MNRNDLIRMKVFGEALAKEAASLLREEARLEWVDNDTAVTWRTPVATASALISHEALKVDDPKVFLTWLREQYPSEVVDVPTVRNPEWLDQMLGTWLAELREGKSVEPPSGTVVEPAGRFRQLNVVPDGTIKRRLVIEVAAKLSRGEIPHLDDIEAWNPPV